MRQLDVAGKTMLEFGPGEMDHWQYWQGRPDHFIAIDIRSDFLETTGQVLRKLGVSYEPVLVGSARHADILAQGKVADVIVSFFNFEHVFPFSDLADDAFSLLRPGGALIGSIPGEGGLLWGLGRVATTRRFVPRNYGLDYDKLICWEHPNFADEVIQTLRQRFVKEELAFLPFRVPSVDLSAVIRFHYARSP